MSIERLDKYGGPHEKLLEEKGINAAFCIPREQIAHKTTTQTLP